MISAVIITLNEESNIERCLVSLQGVADEVVVVDSYSTDRTVPICESFGAKVIQRKWEGYSATKNFANSQAAHPYILSLDADEVLSPELKKSILTAKQSGLEGAYEMNRLTNYCGKWIRHGGWYPDRKVRLFPKHAAEWEGDFVHEQLVLKKGTRVNWLAGDLLHYSYNTKGEFIARSSHYAQLAAKDIVRNRRPRGILKGVVSAGFRFLKMYAFQAGFLDGKAGFEIAGITAKMVFKKYTRFHKKD